MKKRLFVLIISIVLIFGVIPTITASGMDVDTSWYSSSSTSFTITTASQLAGLASLVNAGNDFSGKTITLGNNINLNNEAWTPIGTSTTPFKGTFNGQGYTIQNLSVSGFTCVGLFGYADGSAVIKNVTVTGVASGTSYVGGIVGFTTSEVTVANCTNSAAVNSSGTRTGGVVGHNAGTVSDCTSTGTVASDGARAYTGGIAGYNAGTVSNSYNIGNVSNSSTNAYYTGGIAGSNSGTVSNCHNTGAVSGGASIGGEVGLNDSGIVSNCYNTGTISSGNYNGVTNTGGVAGANNGTVSNSYNIGTVNGGTRTGGVVGRNNLGTVSNCYNIGTVSGGTYNGGVAGGNDATLDNNYYLNTTVSAAIGEGSGTATNVSDKTASQFASGEVTYLLNGSISGGTTWYQNIDNSETADSYPVLSSSSGKVYYGTNCAGTAIYSNYSVSVIHVGSTYDSNGFCTRCGNGYQPATLNSGIYEISNAGQLFWFASLVNGDTTQEGITAAVPDACAVLTSNIDLSVTTSTHTSIEWTPIGSETTPFSGTFDGAGYTVSGMSITKSADYVGLFGYVSAGTVKDLTVSGEINVSGNTMYVGGIVGTVKNGTLSNLTSNVNVTGYDGRKGVFGGVVAAAEGNNGTAGSTVERCTYNGTITASGVLDCVGGIVGYMNAATITNCANYGTVDISGGMAAASDGIYTGGIVGYINNANANVTNCFNVGIISGVDSSSIVSYTGAIIGRINNNVGSVTNCYYLSSDNSTIAGVGANGSGVTVAPTAKTATEFASGEVAYLLNGSVSAGTTWYQNLDNGETVDSYPVLSSSSGTVYYGTNCAGTAIYSNSSVSVIHVGGSYDSNGFCTNCGAYEPATLNTNGVYEISNAGQLFWFAALVNGDTTQEDITAAVADVDGILLADIDLDGREWTPIGDYNSSTSLSYIGTFDGNGYTVSGLYINNDSGNYQGLFGYIKTGGIVKNVTVSGTVTGYNDVGGVSGFNGGTITDCCINVTVSGYRYVGGVTASNTGTITNCSYGSVSGTVTGYYIAGGLVGDNVAAVTDCYVCGTIDGSYNVGSIIGYNNSNGTVSNCYYLNTAADAAIGKNSGTARDAVSKTAAEFASGEVVYLLNSGTTDGTQAWYQNLDNGETVDSYPVLDSSHGTVYYGTNCAGTAIYSNSTVPTADHSWDEGTVTTEATCTGSGVKTYTCTICGETRTETIAATGHSYEAVVTDPTCTEKGYTTYTCTVCGDSYTADETEATGHSYEAVVTEPTCTEKGYTTYTCTVCGDSYTADETEATGHSYEAVVTEPTCTEKGYTTYTCIVCGDSYVGSETEATGHSWDSGVVTKAATCMEKGVTTYTCTVCGETRTEEIAATGHSWGETVYNWSDDGKFCKATRTCENDGSHVEEATATVTSKQTKAATCTEKGETTYTAVFSESWAPNQTKVVADIEATGHSYGEPDWSWAADYSTATATFTCGTCSHTEQVTVNSTSETTAAICTEGGKIVYTATVTFEGLSYSAKETVELSATGHTPGEAVKENEIAATCTEAGSYDSVVYCTICGVEISREKIVVPATGHTAGEAVIENEVESTCTKDGSYDTVVYCTVCGDEISRETIVVPATGHTAGEEAIENKVEATCTKDGSYDTVVYCTVCGEELSRETTVVPATGHTAGEVVIENEVEATCTEEGSYDTVVYCTVCGEELSREMMTIPAKGHTANEAVIENKVEATCTEEGSYDIVTYCTVCGEEVSRETMTIPALGHMAGEAVIENEVEATCTEEGSYDTVVYCTVCGEEVSRETTTISALGHTAGEAVNENEVEATCTEEGSYDIVVYCTVCGGELSREMVTVSAVGHSYGEPVWNWNSDHTEAWAVFTCEHDASHTETVTATITVIENELEILYTATVTFDGQTWTDERTVAQEETSTEETTTPEETTVPEETTTPEETTVPEETTTPEETTAEDETITVEETTATPSNAEEETTASGGSSSVTGDISVGIWIMILFVSGTLVVCTLWFGKKREEA